MVNFIKKVFSDENGEPSSARVVGTLVVIVGLIAFLLGLKGFGTVLATGVTMLGIGQVKSAVVSASKGETPTPPATPQTPTPSNS